MQASPTLTTKQGKGSVEQCPQVTQTQTHTHTNTHTNTTCLFSLDPTLSLMRNKFVVLSLLFATGPRRRNRRVTQSLKRQGQGARMKSRKRQGERTKSLVRKEGQRQGERTTSLVQARGGRRSKTQSATRENLGQLAHQLHICL
jgi:hypothetical protein